jgi:glyoxylase-like metal-dependent hydrolase (beta-lactamase superfamily II)
MFLLCRKEEIVLKKFGVFALCVAFFSGSAMAQDAKTVIANATAALGSGLTSITYSGTAKDVAFQQCGINSTKMICEGTHDPMRPITNYVRVIDLAAPTSRHTGATMNAPGGGATGPPAAGVFNAAVTPQQADMTAPWAQQLELWITPWGFLKGAAANNTTVSRRNLSGKKYSVLSWSPAVKAASGAPYMVNGWVNEDNNMVERVETWLADNIMGDMHILATYTGWKDFGGTKAPSKIVQTRGGWPFFEVDVVAAKMNPPDLASLAPAPAGGGRGGGGGGAPAGAPPAGGGRGGAGGAPPAGAPPAGGGRGGAGGAPPAGAPPAGGQGGRGGGAAIPAAPGGGAPAAAGQGGRGGGQAAAPAAPPVPEKLGEGLWRTTYNYNSLIIDFKDYIMILEAGTNEVQTLAVIAEAKRLIPNKPIRYVMNTHPHSDHTAGIPTMVAEGAAIITHNNNKEFFEKALSTPRTLLTDTLAKNPKPVKVEGVGSKRVFSDGTRVVEFHHIPGAPHSNGLLVAYIPKEKVLFQGDFSLPAAGAPGNDHIKALVPVLQKLNLDFDRYINVHNSPAPQTKAELMKAYEDRVKADAAAK